jgi:hypothetical protein
MTGAYNPLAAVTLVQGAHEFLRLGECFAFGAETVRMTIATVTLVIPIFDYPNLCHYLLPRLIAAPEVSARRQTFGSATNIMVDRSQLGRTRESVACLVRNSMLKGLSPS